jgi:hypothetical protein
MGCDGYITLAKVRSGFEYIDPLDSSHIFFRVTKPVSLIHIKKVVYSVIETYKEPYHGFFNQIADNVDIPILALGRYGYVVVIPLHDVLNIEPSERDIFFIDSDDRFKILHQGSLDQVENLNNWNQIDNGVWAVLRHYTTGSGDDNVYWENRIDPNVKFYDSIDMRVWT